MNVIDLYISITHLFNEWEKMIIILLDFSLFVGKLNNQVSVNWNFLILGKMQIFFLKKKKISSLIKKYIDNTILCKYK